MATPRKVARQLEGYTRDHAKRFAADWYARPASGCDEATLADLLAWAMREVAEEAEAKTRDQIAARLAELAR